MMMKFLIPLLALFATLTIACNLYEEGNAAITYLCKE